MKLERTFFVLAIFLLFVSTLACGLFGDAVESTDTPSITGQSGAEALSDEPVEDEFSNELTFEENPSTQSDSDPQSEYSTSTPPHPSNLNLTSLPELSTL